MNDDNGNRASVLRYPYTRTEIATDTLSGISFEDPYRWLENENPEVQRWQREQSSLAMGYVQGKIYDLLVEAVAYYGVERSVVLPRFAAGHWFRTQAAEEGSHSHVIVSAEPFGRGKLLFSSAATNPESARFISWISPSPDGRTLALGLCEDGSENNTIRLVDVATSRLLDDPPPQTLMDNFLGGVSWLPDSSGFFFTAITGPASDFNQCVYLHRRVGIPTTIPVKIPWVTAQEYRLVLVSRDGNYAIALERLYQPIPVAYASLSTMGALTWRPFVTECRGTLAGHIVANRYIAVTDVGAPRGRLVAINLDTENPNDPGSWIELIGESSAVLRTATPIGKLLYLSEIVDTYTRIRIVDYDGHCLGEVPLPHLGSINELPFHLLNLVPKGHPEKFIFGFSSLTVSPGVYSYALEDEELEELRVPRVRLNAVVQDHRALSADGTSVPYHIVRRADLSQKRPHPTLIYAYGGHYVPLMPQFPGPMAAFIAAGGILVHAHIRGGGELGLEWWRSGCARNSQKSYDDLYAIAGDLIAHNVCTPQSLGVVGASHGGLMARVALTQRPSLWAAVVARVPLLDLIGGACRSAYNRWSTTTDRADIDDPEEVRRLATFSPYHLVRDGVRYPAVFIEAGSNDYRVAAWHARKFAARLQAAAGDAIPVLLHVWENVGHGWATNKDVAVMQNAEWLAFAMRHLGLEWPDTTHRGHDAKK